MTVGAFKSYLERRAVPGLADAAISLAVPCFPCDARKAPLTAHGFKDASADPDQIRRWFAAPAAVMIGIPTGSATDFVVIDVDVKDSRQGMDWLDANRERMPQTRTIRTGSGGLHIYLRWPGRIVRNSASKIAPGIDVRGDGGYVIVPPSPGYAVADDAPVADVPEWLLVVLCPAEPPARAPTQRVSRPLADGGTIYGLAALRDACDAIRSAGNGTKHDTLNRECYGIGGLVAAGEVQEGIALAELTSALADIRPTCKDYQAAEKTLRRAFQDGVNRPRPAVTPPAAPIHPAAALIARMGQEASQKLAKPLPVTPDLMAVDGVLRMLVDECVRTAIRPQPFLALGAAICAVGALAGRQYRTATDLRSNVYVAAIAESGAGKDHAAEVTRRAIDAAGLGRYLGGETLASGRAVLSSIEHHPAKLFQIDEFGLFLAAVTGKKAAPHRAEIWAELMKLYSRAKGTYRGTEYANKKENPRIDIHQPCVCFYGTTTPSTFWAALAGGAMSDGSLARFLVFVSDSGRPERNREAGIFMPSDQLIASLRAIAAGPGAAPPAGNLPAVHLAPMVATTALDAFVVPFAPEAERLHDRKLAVEDAWATKVAGTPQAAIVNRLGENAAKLALISAVSRDPAAPVIASPDVQWGWALAEHCIRSLLQDADRFLAENEFEAKLNRTLEIVRKHGPITARDMFPRGFKFTPREGKEVLDTLLNAGLIVAEASKPGAPGRPTVRYSAIPIGNGEVADDE